MDFRKLMTTSSLQKTLLVVIGVGATLCLFSLVAVHQLHKIDFSMQGPAAKLEKSNAFTLTVKIDDSVIQNISKSILENLHNYADLCALLTVDVKLPMIYIVTPTYKRPEQIPDLTRLAQTLMHVPSITWLVIEDAVKLDPQVEALLRRSHIKFHHMVAPMPAKVRKRKVVARGVSNRNKALKWIRDNVLDRSGLVYFADDDNTYDLRLFSEIRSVKKVGMWPVGLLTTYGLSAPIVENGSVVGFYDGWVGGRRFPVDMAGFAVSVGMILDKANVTMPFIPGHEEDHFLRRLNVTLSDIEPKADNCTKLYVWHTKTVKNKKPVKLNMTVYGSTNIVELYQQIK